MSSARANANQALYLAKILLAGWDAARADAQIAATTIEQAYLPAVRAHLLDAYGWFLLELAGDNPAPGQSPPGRCDQLAPVPAGKAVCGELRECAQLERSGWLADLVTAEQHDAPVSVSPGNLASPLSSAPDREDAGNWADGLEQLFGRMRDSLEEC